MITRMLTLPLCAVTSSLASISKIRFTQIRQWGAALAITLPLLFTSPTSQADVYYDYPDESTSEYPFRTAWLIGIGAASTGFMLSGVANDKKMHFAGSVVLGAGSEYMLRQLNYQPDNRWQRIFTATALGLIPGLIKEATDSKFDGGDLAADLAGSFVGAVVSDLLQGPVHSMQPLFSLSVGKDHIGLMVSQRF